MVGKLVLPLSALAFMAAPALAKDSKASTQTTAPTAATAATAETSSSPAATAAATLDNVAPDKLTVQMPVKSSDAQVLGTVAGVAVDNAGKLATIVVKPAAADDQGLRAIAAQQGRIEADSIITNLSLAEFKALPVVSIGAAQNQNNSTSPSAQN